MLNRLCAIITALSAAAASAGTIVDTNFNDVTPGTYTAADNITLGGLTVTGNVDVVSIGAGNNALALKNISGSAVAVTFPALATGATGENRVKILADFMIPSLGATISSGQAYMVLGTAASTGGSAVQNQFYRSSGLPTAQPFSGTPVSLVRDVWYRMAIDVDLSSVTQDTYTIKIIRISDSAEMSSQSVNTRNANIAPTTFALFASNIDTSTDGAGKPIIYLDNVSVVTSAVPEVSSLSMLTLGGLTLLSPRRR